jgi:rhodanese-related sulfurtransferase
MESVKTIPAADVPKIANDCVIIDVRTPAEHAEAHLQRAHDHVPLDTLNPRDFMLRRGLDKDAALYILCRSGARATAAAQKFAAEGYSNVHVIEGGIISCEECGEPVVKNDVRNDNKAHAAAANAAAEGKAALNNVYARLGRIPLDGQVRLFAGALVLLGTILGLAGAEIFYLLPLAVGGGLVYSGITGWCGLALGLAKAPWNKGTGAACASSFKGVDGNKDGGACA